MMEDARTPIYNESSSSLLKPPTCFNVNNIDELEDEDVNPP